MNLELRSIADAGNFEKERITLRVKASGDVGDFILVQSGLHGLEPTIKIHFAYWFPYKEVSIGDIVVVYTKGGTAREGELRTGKKAHFFYWNLGRPIWNEGERAAVLMNAPEWEFSTSKRLQNDRA